MITNNYEIVILNQENTATIRWISGLSSTESSCTIYSKIISTIYSKIISRNCERHPPQPQIHLRQGRHGSPSPQQHRAWAHWCCGLGRIFKPPFSARRSNSLSLLCLGRRVLRVSSFLLSAWILSEWGAPSSSWDLEVLLWDRDSPVCSELPPWDDDCCVTLGGVPGVIGAALDNCALWEATGPSRSATPCSSSPGRTLVPSHSCSPCSWEAAVRSRSILSSSSSSSSSSLSSWGGLGSPPRLASSFDLFFFWYITIQVRGLTAK